MLPIVTRRSGDASLTFVGADGLRKVVDFETGFPVLVDVLTDLLRDLLEEMRAVKAAIEVITEV